MGEVTNKVGDEPYLDFENDAEDAVFTLSVRDRVLWITANAPGLRLFAWKLWVLIGARVHEDVAISSPDPAHADAELGGTPVAYCEFCVLDDVEGPARKDMTLFRPEHDRIDFFVTRQEVNGAVLALNQWPAESREIRLFDESVILRRCPDGPG